MSDAAMEDQPPVRPRRSVASGRREPVAAGGLAFGRWLAGIGEAAT